MTQHFSISPGNWFHFCTMFVCKKNPKKQFCPIPGCCREGDHCLYFGGGGGRRQELR